ncbi:MAG: hypothetical protein B7Y41_00250 [Hydrogenophilales bacterium 28-61-23]|nr:MAG: hypothetical protein B7Y41_00250 [Hydrogenophilales bacterium 28-61-23]
MNLFKRNVLAAALLAALVSPAAVMADQVPAPTEAVEQPAATPAADRMDLMQTMRNRMFEMMQATDPAKRKELMDAQVKDMEAMKKMAPPAGMGMGMGMGMGPGAGMMGPRGRCDQRIDRARLADTNSQRLDALEKRMDLMQATLQMLLRD